MSEMPRPRPPHLQRQISRHGTVSWVVRVGHGPRIYIRAPYESPEFKSEYHSAIRGDAPHPRRGKGSEGALGWLVARWQASSEWATLARATQRQRINILKHVLAEAETFPFREIGKAEIIAGRERRSATPSQANNFLNTMRSLFKWAIANDFLESNPTDGVKNVRRPNTGGFHSWTEAEVEQFERRWPVGTRERLAFSILLYTGLRRGDAARLGRQHVSKGVIYIRSEKTDTQVTIPVLPELQQVLDASRVGNLTFIATQRGTAMVKESFGTWFKEACKAAGVPGSAHGLRKATATRFANAGVTEAELDAIMGWSPGSGMSRIYTRRRDLEKLARRAVDKLQKNEPATSYAQPDKKVGREDEKLSNIKGTK